MCPRFRFPMKLHKARFALGIDKSKCMNPKTLHHAVAAGNGAIGHDPKQHMGRLRHQRHEVPECVMRRRCLWHRVMWLGLDRVDQIRKFHRVLDEEDWNVVAHQVPIAFVSVELDRKSAYIPRGVSRTAFARDCRKTHEHRCALAGFGKNGGTRNGGERLETFEISVCGRAARVNDPFGNALVVEVSYFLTKDEVLQECGTSESAL